MKLKNKVAVVTGASDGIGKAIALCLAKEGVKLALIGRDEQRLSNIRNKALKDGSPEVKTYQCDFLEVKNIPDTVKAITSDFSTINILINNAGIWHIPAPLEEINKIDDIITVNLRAQIHLTQLLLPELKKAKLSALINVSSSSGVKAPNGQSVYSASKWGMRGFTEVLKVDLKESHVRVAGVYQGGTQTKLFEKAGDMRDVSSYTNPKDLADAVVYMLSRPDNMWIHEIRIQQ